MLAARRFLPSLSLLSAFEATARTGSITAAARELALTQSAVSRQIKALEEQLEVQLFLRERQTVQLTQGGGRYAREIRDALRRISTASLNLRGDPFGGTLTLAIPPTFGARWLAPRLSKLLEFDASFKINLISKHASFDFEGELVDAAIHYGTENWAGCEIEFLRHETVIPACSPSLKSRFNFQTAEAFVEAPLLHLTSRPDAWERWLEFNQVRFQPIHGMLFDQLTIATEAAIAGVGVALLPEFLIFDELSSGRLVKAIDLPMLSDAAYYLVWPKDRGEFPPLLRFRTWLLSEMALAPNNDPS